MPCPHQVPDPGMITWQKKEILGTEIKTKRLVTIDEGFHPKSSILRLHTKRKETTKIQEYVRKMPPNDDLLIEYLRQQKPSEEKEEGDQHWGTSPCIECTNKEVADIIKIYQWLEKAGLRDSTEALIMAAQEQAFNTRPIEARVCHTRRNPRFQTVQRCPWDSAAINRRGQDEGR